MGVYQPEEAMLDRQYQSDPHYLDAHYVERRRAGAAHPQSRQASALSMRERLFQTAGDALIAWGQKLKQASEPSFNDLCQDCP
jgi:hypothetical protein